MVNYGLAAVIVTVFFTVLLGWVVALIAAPVALLLVYEEGC